MLLILKKGKYSLNMLLILVKRLTELINMLLILKKKVNTQPDHKAVGGLDLASSTGGHGAAEAGALRLFRKP